jgi:ABC-type phosphate transport system substrate-binding protein
MRLVGKLLAAGGAVALIAASAVPALADPPHGVTPRPGDVVGVGSDTIGYLLDQFSHDYNKTHPQAPALLYSWDPVGPAGKTGGAIVTKAGCKAIARPDGSSAGIAALEANTIDPADPNDFCVDYAGSSRAATASDPGCAVPGICFVPFASDAVTWAARDAASGGTDAPASLTLAQLKNIYQCKITDWPRVGGKKAPIRPFLPQTSSGTRAFWLTALGGGTPVKPGSCVSDVSNTLQDNQGTSPALDSPEAIVPYSVADYIAQVYHDAPCTVPSCGGSPACTPAGSENLFGCDQHGVLGIKKIGGTKPVLPWPPPLSPPCLKCKINPNFSKPFQRVVYIVVRAAATHDDIPAYLEPFFAAKTASPPGFVCASPTAQTDITNYGFSAQIWAGRGGRQLPACGIPHWDHYRPRG